MKARWLGGATAVNALYAVADYVSQPLAMLCATPYLLRRLGTEQYGVWMLASAAVSGGALLWSGFGDAAVKHLSNCRGREDREGAERLLRTLLLLHLGLGFVLAAALGALSPVLAGHLPAVNEAVRRSYQQALDVGCLLLVVKSVEIVFISAQRAYESYGPAATVSIAMRVSTTGAAVVTAVCGGGVVAILWATLVLTVAGTVMQGRTVWREMAPRSLWPRWDATAAKEVFSFGCFSWLQGAAGLLSGQADRLMVGWMLGAQAVAYYSVCVQAAQPIHGVVGAGMHVLFPHLGARMSAKNTAEIRRKTAKAFAVNVLLVTLLAAPLLLGARLILRLWMGEAFAQQAGGTLVLVAVGFALTGLNVTGHYVLMAMGKIRLIASLNLIAAAAMLVGMALLMPRLGITGAAVARLVYGPITWLSYRWLRGALRPVASESAVWRACENG